MGILDSLILVMREGEITYLKKFTFLCPQLYPLLRWMWLNSATDVEFTSWASNQTDNAVTPNFDDCAKMDKGNRYQWMTMRCDEGNGERPLCMKMSQTFTEIQLTLKNDEN